MPAKAAAALGVRVKSNGDLKLRRGVGCERCRNTGYLGRVAALEVMPFSDDLRRLAMSGEPVKAIKTVARQEGMTTLRENALKLMFKGVTTIEEVLRVTVED